jgi:beta-phosphoglucomutase-like phosphatase (HAD superfamily)
VIESLKSNDLLHYFDYVVTAEDVENPKPAPDVRNVVVVTLHVVHDIHMIYYTL